MTDIFTSNAEKYHDTDMYDLLNEPSKQELPILLKQINKEDQILELACGTGRLAIPLAKEGYHVTGVDIHEGMLKKAAEKATKEGLSISFHQQDCTQLSLSNQYDFIFMVGNSFQHFLTNESQDQLLASVLSHLKPGGRLVFDTRNPILSELAKIDAYDLSFKDYRGYDVKEQHVETYEEESQILHCKTSRELWEEDTFIRKEEDQILLRYTYPLEMKRLLSSHDLSIKESYGDWQENSISNETPQMIYVCVKQKN